jgi:hypothetical protein
MAIFRKVNTMPAAAVHEQINAAAGVAGNPNVNNFIAYQSGFDRANAMLSPTISRSRDLICSMVGALSIGQYSLQWAGEDLEEMAIPPDVWMQQPDPSTTRNWILSQTTDDLIFHGRAFWVVKKRNGYGFPTEFEWIPAASVQTLDQQPPVWFGMSNQLTFTGLKLETQDVIQFLSPINGLLYTGQRALQTAFRLDRSAERFATNETPAGYLQQKGGEPMSGEDLSNLAAAWSAARRESAIGALNEYVEWVESSLDPSKLQLTEARTYQALELARVANIPPYLVGAPTGGGMTYANAQQARQDLYLFGAKPYIDCIEQTLSMNNVLPRGRYCKLDVAAYLESYDLGAGSDPTAAGAEPAATNMGE